jgi:DNA-binding transcriptional regulator YdaS (Cro superfamily)
MHFNYKLHNKIRQNCGTQNYFANFIGVNSSIVSQVINGRYNLTHEEKSRWASALGCNVNELFGEPITT